MDKLVERIYMYVFGTYLDFLFGDPSKRADPREKMRNLEYEGEGAPFLSPARYCTRYSQLLLLHKKYSTVMASFHATIPTSTTGKYSRKQREDDFSGRNEERYSDDGFDEPDREHRYSDDTAVKSSSKPTKMFTYVKERNWSGVVRRCMGDDKTEAATWIADKNSDGSVRWKCLPLHQVRTPMVTAITEV